MLIKKQLANFSSSSIREVKGLKPQLRTPNYSIAATKNYYRHFKPPKGRFTPVALFMQKASQDSRAGNAE